MFDLVPFHRQNGGEKDNYLLADEFFNTFRSNLLDDFMNSNCSDPYFLDRFKLNL